MGSGYYFTRLAAVLFTIALLGAVIMRPEAGKHYASKAASLQPDPSPLAAKTCPPGEPAFRAPFASIEDVLSISPLGGVTAPGEPLPAPYIRINTRKGETIFERLNTRALAPARADVTAIERRIERDKDGGAVSQSWTVHFAACKTVAFYYDRLDEINPRLVERAGGLAAFTEIGGPDHTAIKTQLRVRPGDVIGEARGFNVGLQDLNAPPATFVRPERYQKNPYMRAAVFDTDPELLKAINADENHARCPIDYLPDALAEEWAQKLGDSWGMRRSKGENTCRVALADLPDTAQGAWFTDASHNAATTKVSAVALSHDAIDTSRMIFALHGRLRSLTPDLVALAPMQDRERAAAAKDFLSAERGEGRINTGFGHVKTGEIYCYQRLRTNFVGPRINGVILLQTSLDASGADLMMLEARGDVQSCIDLEQPWVFTGQETTFYR